MTALILRAGALHLPLADDSADLILTSPPYWRQRNYAGGGGLGAEPGTREYLSSLWCCTHEWMRVLRPGGSLFVVIGDKRGSNKSLTGLPWRYAAGCTDRLGLVLRAEIIWEKPGAMPESARDRVRGTHEHVFHLTRPGRFYYDLDAIREPYLQPDRIRSDTFGGGSAAAGVRHAGPGLYTGPRNPLGRVPGSVWRITTSPLIAPRYRSTDGEWLRRDRDAWRWLEDGGADCSLLPRDDKRAELRTVPPHCAAFPPELCRRIILGWSPPGGIVLDPMGGTGTTAMAADVLGRTGITADLSGAYSQLASWRIADPGQRSRVTPCSACP